MISMDCSMKLGKYSMGCAVGIYTMVQVAWVLACVTNTLRFIKKFST